MRPRDTSPEAWEMVVTAASALTIQQRADRLVGLNRSIDAVAGAEIGSRHPDYDEKAVGLALRRAVIGDECSRRCGLINRSSICERRSCGESVGAKADLTIVKDDPFGRSEFARRRSVTLRGTDLHCLARGRGAGEAGLGKGRRIGASTRRRGHVPAVDRATIDWAYVDRWAAELGVARPTRAGAGRDVTQRLPQAER